MGGVNGRGDHVQPTRLHPYSTRRGLSEKTAVAMKPKLYALACRWYHNAQQAPLPKKIGQTQGMLQKCVLRAFS